MAMYMLEALRMIRDTEWDISLILRLNRKLEKNGLKAKERISLKLQAPPRNFNLNCKMKDITSKAKEMPSQMWKKHQQRKEPILTKLWILWQQSTDLKLKLISKHLKCLVKWWAAKWNDQDKQFYLIFTFNFMITK